MIHTEFFHTLLRFSETVQKQCRIRPALPVRYYKGSEESPHPTDNSSSYKQNRIKSEVSTDRSHEMQKEHRKKHPRLPSGQDNA